MNKRSPFHPAGRVIRMTPVMKRVCEHYGWTLIQRTDEVRGVDWLVTPSAHTEGPVMAFNDLQGAVAYAEQHNAVDGTVKARSERRHA